MSEQPTKQVFKCDVCGKEFENPRLLASHMRTHRKVADEQAESTQRQGQDEQKEKAIAEVPPPPDERYLEDAINFISERLPKVYGIEKYTDIIVAMLRDDPTPMRDPATLHAFIKTIAPRAYDMHIEFLVVKPLYSKYPDLPATVERVIQSRRIYPYQAYIQPHVYTSPPVSTYSPYHHYHYYAQHVPTYAHYQPLVVEPPLRRRYKIVVDGQEVETDEAGYMAWLRFKREEEEREMRKRQYELEMKKLETEIKKLSEGSEKLVPAKVGDREIMVPASIATILMIREKEDEYKRRVDEMRAEVEKLREELHRKELEFIRKEIEELKSRPPLHEEIKYILSVAESLGYGRTGRTSVDVLSDLIERVDQRAAQLIAKIQPSEFRSEIKRSPEERVTKAEETIRRLEKAEELIEAEERLIRAASKVLQQRSLARGEERGVQA